MLAVKLNLANYEYDVHSLVKAFYPAEELVFAREEEIQDWNVLLEPVGDELVLKCRFGETVKEDAISLIGEKPEVKNRFKFCFYQALSKITGKKLPWGNLTGIRPTKLAMMMLEQEKSDTEIKAFLQGTHLVSDEKCELGIGIAKREKAILDRLDCKRGYSLYIGIPFCPTTCLYCSFTSNPIFKWKNRMQEYIDAMKKEIDFWSETYKDRPLNTIYIGGGTPTTLSAEQLDAVMQTVKSNFDLSFLREYTVEAGRPDTITPEKLKVIKKMGATRISINPQTMNDNVLSHIGRNHTASQTVEAFNLARKLGFDNINTDLIAGLPTDTFESFKDTLFKVLEMNPESVTVHSLSMKRSSNLSTSGNLPELEAGKTAGMMVDYALETLSENNILPYYMYRQSKTVGNLENVGYSKKGYECLYNVFIMDETHTILSCGASAVTKLREPFGNQIERIFNYKYPYEYITKFDEILNRKKRIKEFYDLYKT